MKITTFICFLIFTFNLSSGELRIDNDKPDEQSIVTITYSGEKQGNQSLISYHFKDGERLPTAMSEPLKPSTKFKIYPNDNFIILKVIDENGNVDDNNGSFWDIIVYSDWKPKKNSYLNKALSYLGATGENYTRVPNFEMIKSSLESELKNYAKNFRAKIAYETLKLDFKLIAYDEYEKNILETLDTKLNIENELNISAAIKALYSINEKDKADDLKEQFISDNPKSEMAKDKKLENLSNVNSFDEFVESIADYLNNNYNDKDISTVYNSFVFAHSQSKEFMDKLDNNITLLNQKPAYFYNEIALTYLEEEDLRKAYGKDLSLKRAEKYIDSAFTAINNLEVFKPKDVSEPEWDIYKSKVESDLYLSEFKLNLLKMDSTAALKSVLMAVEKAPYQMNSFLYKDAISLANDYGTKEDIKSLIKDSYGNNAIDNEFEKYLLELISERNDIEISYLNNLIKKSKNEQTSKLKNSMNKSEKLTGFVQKLDDTFLDLESLKGKIKIVSISSTWCDVCTDVYPVLNSLNAKYKQDPNVEIIGISVWEDDSPQDAVNNLIKEFEISYPYYIDNTDIVPRKLNVFGFPTIMIVDKDNYIRYTIRGFNSNEELEKLINEFVNILD